MLNQKSWESLARASWKIQPNDQLKSRVKGLKLYGLEKIGLYLDSSQHGHQVIKGYDLAAKLEGHQVMEDDALDYLLAHPKLIPEFYKHRNLFFFGTIYLLYDGSRVVRYLTMEDKKPCSRTRLLVENWGNVDPCAILAS